MGDYFNVSEYLNDFRDINIIIGARGIGKTYSLLRYLVESGEKFLYMRNTKTQIDECSGEFGNPFKALNNDIGYDIRVETSKNHGFIMLDDKIIGYVAALSTFENLRGVDLSDVKYIIFDEFIELARLRFNQFEAFVNAYETINRNREFKGERALQVFLLSNAQKLDSQILAGFNLIPDIEGMIKAGQVKYKRDNISVLLPNVNISNMKKQSGIYRAIAGSDIYKENIENKFSHDSYYGVKREKDINGFIPIACVDDVYIYRSKAGARYYFCSIPSQNVPVFNTRDNYIPFMRNIGSLFVTLWGSECLSFSDYTTKLKIKKILKI